MFSPERDSVLLEDHTCCTFGAHPQVHPKLPHPQPQSDVDVSGSCCSASSGPCSTVAFTATGPQQAQVHMLIIRIGPLPGMCHGLLDNAIPHSYSGLDGKGQNWVFVLTLSLDAALLTGAALVLRHDGF